MTPSSKTIKYSKVKKKAPKGTYKITVEAFEDFDYDETTKIRTVYKGVKKTIKIKVK